MKDEIIRLSALEDAIHRPMGGYSSGMASRLRFAIAVAARPKILLIDEALSTGDATFASRSEEAMNEMLSDAGTVFLVNHAAKVIQEMCDRAIWMNDGQIIMDGDAEDVAERYRWWSWNVAKGELDTARSLLEKAVEEGEMQDVRVVKDLALKDTAPRHARRGRIADVDYSRPASRWPVRSSDKNLTFPTDMLPVVNDVSLTHVPNPRRASDVVRH